VSLRIGAGVGREGEDVAKVAIVVGADANGVADDVGTLFAEEQLDDQEAVFGDEDIASLLDAWEWVQRCATRRHVPHETQTGHAA
jgi:hypothetical protein